MAAAAEPPSAEASVLANLDSRAREIFRRIVDSYLASGEPVGSRHLSRLLPISLSPASVRNVMQDLEEVGLIYAPHTSAGRLPTQLGLRFYVDALLEFGGLAREERARIDSQVRAAAEEGGLRGRADPGDRPALRSDPRRRRRARPRRTICVSSTSSSSASTASGRWRCWSARMARSRTASLRRPPACPPRRSPKRPTISTSHVRGRTLAEARDEIARSRDAARGELDALAARLVDAGLASWAGAEEASRQLIVRGQANLIADLHADADLERIRRLFADLETQTDVIDLLHRAEDGEGVKIFIGAENKLFSLSGSSMIAAPLRGGDRRVAGVLGVIGPTRLNYGRIVPMVEYAAQVLGDLKRSR